MQVIIDNMLSHHFMQILNCADDDGPLYKDIIYSRMLYLICYLCARPNSSELMGQILHLSMDFSRTMSLSTTATEIGIGSLYTR